MAGDRGSQTVKTPRINNKKAREKLQRLAAPYPFVFSYIQRERESSGDDAVIAVTVER
jgi:hypothetical protein